MGSKGFRPYILKVSRKSNRLQMSLQRQHWLLSNLKSLSVFALGIWTRDLSADQRSPGWANQTTEVNKNLAHCYLIMEILTYHVRVINKHFGQKSTANFTICLLLFSIWFPLFRKANYKSPHVRESMTVLDSRFHTVDSGFQLLDSGFQKGLDSNFFSVLMLFFAFRFRVRILLYWKTLLECTTSLFSFSGRMYYSSVGGFWYDNEGDIGELSTPQHRGKI